MIKQTIDVNGYWKVIVYYDINYNLFNHIATDLHHIGTQPKSINRIYKNMITNKAKAVTVSNIDMRTSVVAFNYHKDKYDYINSIVHEAEHVKQAMLEGYNIEDKGEHPAYTIGYLVMKMLMFLNMLR